MVPLCTGEQWSQDPRDPLEILFVSAMNDNHHSCVDPNGINYLILDHSRQTSDLHHRGDYTARTRSVFVVQAAMRHGSRASLVTL